MKWSFCHWLGLALGVSTPEASPPVTGPDFPFWPYLVKVLVILGAMLGVMLLAAYLLKKLMPRYRSDQRLIKILATHYLAPKQALILVAVGQETFLLASSAGHLSVIPLAHSKGESLDTAPLTVKPPSG